MSGNSFLSTVHDVCWNEAYETYKMVILIPNPKLIFISPSLPTPQPAGARPTVMGVFPGSLPHGHGHVHAGATIHISNPEKRKHVRTIFGDTPDPSNMLRGRSRSVSVCVTERRELLAELTTERTTKYPTDRTTDMTRMEKNSRFLRRRHSIVLSPSKQAALHALVVANTCAIECARAGSKVRKLLHAYELRRIIIIFQISCLLMPIAFFLKWWDITI